MFFIGGFVLCFVGAIFLPILIRLEFGVGKGLTPPAWLELRLWGIRVMRFPGKRSGRSSVLARWALRGLDSLLSPDSDKPKELPKTPAKRKSSKWGFGFIRWAGMRLATLVARLTRRFHVRGGGIDPALLGVLTGVAASLQGILGARRFAWIPDFAPTGPWIGVRWDLSISIWKLVRWVGETFVDRKRRPERGRVL